MRNRKYLVWLLLSLIWVRAFAQDQRSTEWMKSSELSVLVKKMDEDRMFPGVVEGRVNGTSIQYRARFIPFLHNLDVFYAKWGMSDHWYKYYTERSKEAGLTEHSHTTFVDQSGSTVHQATWVLISE